MADLDIILHPGRHYRRQDIRFPEEPACAKCWRVPDTVKHYRGKLAWDRICLSCREQEQARERAARSS